MKRVILLFGALGFFVMLGLAVQHFAYKDSVVQEQALQNSGIDEAEKVKVAADYGKLPLHFEPNVGQTDKNVDFVSRGQGYSLFLTDGEAVLALSRSSENKNEVGHSNVVHIQLVGAKASETVRGEERLAGKSNYLLGNDPSQWQTDVPHYGKVKYDDVYPGIDLVYYGTEQGQLEHDFVVAPGSDPNTIRFAVAGTESLGLDEKGNLIASTDGGDLVLQAPVTYQDIGDVRQSVESKYVVMASADDVGQVVGFELGAYDAAHPVVIDPVLSYATYLGGSNTEEGLAIAVDGSGNAYVTGFTLSSNFPTASAYQPAHAGGNHDAFVTKLNSAGSALVYSTYLGGTADDFGFGITVDGSGNAYVIGLTTSTNFPTASAYQSAHAGGTDDGFLTKLNSAGSALVYSTYLGGSSFDQGRSVAVDGSGNAYVTGITQSSNFPTASAYQATHAGGAQDAFVTKFNSAGSALTYSTYLGGSTEDLGFSIAVDGSGNAYVTGSTSSSNFPTASAYQATNGGSDDVFVTKFNNAGSALTYSTYLGGSSIDQSRGIALDGSGNAYVTGYTRSSNFPTASAYLSAHAGGNDDAFVTKLNSAGSALVYSTYLGGTSDDFAFGIAVDGLDKAFVTGYTASSNFPTASAHQATHGGNNDIFVTVLTSAGSTLDYSTFLGSTGRDDGRGIAVDGAGNAVITGWTNDSSFPTVSPYQASFGGNEDVILAKITGFATSLGISIPDTVAQYGSTVDVPIRVTDTSGLGVVASEISVTYRKDIVLSAVTSLTTTAGTATTNSMVYQGWSIEENVFAGASVDTLTIAMSTAQDTLTGEGDLIYLTLQVADIRHPDSTPLELVSVLFNDGTPGANATDGSLTIIGTDGSIVASPDSINPADVVTVTITDADFDVDVGTAEQVTASAVSKVYGDTETVTLTETGVNTGIFIGTLNTSFSLVADPSQNGTLGTIAGDSICVSYLDSLDSVGASVTRVDTVEVIGGTDGTVAISYVVQALDGRNGLRDTVRVQVSDADLDTDVGVAEQVSATVTNTISGEIETLTLTETGLNTGVFQIRVPTIAGASGTNNNGEFSLASWDTLSLSYNDALSAQGGLNVVQDIGRVVNLFGDVRVNDQVQAFDAARLLAISVGLISANTQTTLVGDVDGNSSIQAFDASRVLQYVVRLIDRFGVQTDFVADPKNHPFEKPVPLGNVIALGELEDQGDGTFLLPVSLGEREGILSGTLTLGVDAGIEIVDVDLANAYSSFMVAHNMTSEGLKVAFAGSQSEQSGSGDVLMLKVRGVEGSPILLSLDHVVLNGQTLTPSVNIEAMEEVITQAPELITELHQNIPNPFNPQTTIKYAIAEAGQVEIVIYSVTGQRIRALMSEFQDVGAYQIVWDGKDAVGRDVSSGVYLMRMQATGFTQTKKMLLLR